MNNSQEGTFTCPSLGICSFGSTSKIFKNMHKSCVAEAPYGYNKRKPDNSSTDLTVAEYLEQNNYQTNRIVVELNEEILPKYLYSETRLKDGDSMEIVTFVGGG